MLKLVCPSPSSYCYHTILIVSLVVRNVTEVDLQINFDRFQCKERRCEVYNDRIYLDFKHRPSNHKSLSHGVTFKFNSKSG